MNNGVVSRVMLGGLLGVVAVGCGSSDDKKDTTVPPKMGAATADCGTEQEPLTLTISNVSPALGATVPNSGIVQSFTIVGQHLQVNPTLGFAATHTAGQSVPATTQYMLTLNGADTVYTSLPFAWQTAPGHVELVPRGLLVTPDGCVSTFPTPVFKYDVTAP